MVETLAMIALGLLCIIYLNYSKKLEKNMESHFATKAVNSVFYVSIFIGILGLIRLFIDIIKFLYL